MGRAKLNIEYRENSRARLATYLTRMKGLKKKATKLFVLCGVDVLFASYSPEYSAVTFWPEHDTPEFRRKKEQYCRLRGKEMISSPSTTTTPCPSSPSILEEMAAMDAKLKEVRERIWPPSRLLRHIVASSKASG